MRDLYELVDLRPAEYIVRTVAIRAELSALTPALLEDFTIFWQKETSPTAKRQFLSLIFENV
jgi:hypothetical protein